MLQHLRLARARGSLKSPNSPVQDRALKILDGLEEYDRLKSRGDQRRDMVKALIVNPFVSLDQIKFQFPEYFDPFEEARQEDGTYDIDRVDDSHIEWDTPVTPQDDEALSRWIAEREHGEMSAAEWEE